jgi:hypothetical protein
VVPELKSVPGIKRASKEALDGSEVIRTSGATSREMLIKKAPKRDFI